VTCPTVLDFSLNPRLKLSADESPAEMMRLPHDIFDHTTSLQVIVPPHSGMYCRRAMSQLNAWRPASMWSGSARAMSKVNDSLSIWRRGISSQSIDCSTTLCPGAGAAALHHMKHINPTETQVMPLASALSSLRPVPHQAASVRQRSQHAVLSSCTEIYGSKGTFTRRFQPAARAHLMMVYRY